MDEQKKTPAFNINNTATQKTVRLKPMSRKPAINVEEGTSANPANSIVGEKSVSNNTTRPSLLKSTASVPIRKVSAAPRTPSSSLGDAVNKQDSIVNSLNLKPKAPVEPIAQETVAAPAIEEAHTTKIGKVTPASLASSKAAMASALNNNIGKSVAPTQKFEPVIKAEETTEDSDDKTVKLKRPERKVASTPNSIVPPIAKPATVATPEAPVASTSAETVKLDLPKRTPSTPEATTVVAPKLTIPTLEKKTEAKAEEVKAEEPKDVELADTKGKKAKKAEVAAQSTVTVESEGASKFYCFSFVAVLLLVLIAVGLSAIQYLNTHELDLIGGNKIEIPVVNNLVQK